MTSGYAAHIGQVFWDQDLIDAVETTSPYASNTASLTTNAEDGILGNIISNTDSDPFFNYVYLGDSLEDGLFGWLTIGINTSASYTPTYSFELTEDGGVAVAGAGGTSGGGGGGGGPGGGPPGSAGNPTATTTGGSATSATTSGASATASSNSGPS